MRRRLTGTTLTATFVALAAVAATVSCGGSSAASTVSGAQPGGATPPAGAPGATPPAGAQSGGAPPDFAVIIGDALQSLVDDGTLTEAQMNAVQTTLSKSAPGAPSPRSRPSAQQGDAAQPQDMFSGALDGLVSDGTLTDAQEQAVSNALTDSIRPPPSTGQ